MNTQIRWIGGATTAAAAVALATFTTLATPPRPALAADCPGDGTVRIWDSISVQERAARQTAERSK